MLLPEHGSEIAVCEPSGWDTGAHRVWRWRTVLRELQKSIRRRPASAKPETRLVQMVANLQRGSDTIWSEDPELLPRLEAELATTDDLELRNVFANFLCEP